MGKPICTVMVGLPGLGKSTFIESVRDTYTFVYSTDAILERIAGQLGKTYNDVFAEHIKNATEEANIDLAYATKERKDIIWDQTNLGAGKRSKIIHRMKKEGYTVRCVCFVPPEAGHIDDLKLWANRLKNRPGKTIPQNILTNMCDSYVEPSLDEGFDKIDFYNMHGALISSDDQK